MGLLEVPPRCYEKKHTEDHRLQYQGSTPHIPSATGQQIFCSDSSALFLTRDYMVVWIFFEFTADLDYFCLNCYLSPFHHWYMPRRCYLCLLSVTWFWKTSQGLRDSFLQSHHGDCSCTRTIGQSHPHGRENCPLSHHRLLSIYLHSYITVIFVLIVEEVPKLSYLCVPFLQELFLYVFAFPLTERRKLLLIFCVSICVNILA